eukprot:scaffold74192_cov68-Cyclotella_meneghiniana.AAC.2
MTAYSQGLAEKRFFSSLNSRLAIASNKLRQRKMPVERSATVAATPETIWNTCFVPMKWESWDPDLKELIDVTGGCENGTTCTFVMKDGNNIPTKLSNVEKNESLTFSGAVAGGLLKFEGTVLITPVDASNSKIDYKFGLEGLIGAMMSLFMKKAVVGGTQGGLDNMVKLSEEAQKK